MKLTKTSFCTFSIFFILFSITVIQDAAAQNDPIVIYQPHQIPPTGANFQNVMPANNKRFTQQEAKQPIQLRWTPLIPTPPDNGKQFTEQEAKPPSQLRWVPVVPMPRDEVVYKVRVFEIGTAQNAAQAVRTNTPVFEKEVRTTQTIWQMPGEYTSSKEGKTFVWNVQALNREGKPYGANNGMSESTVFRTSSPGF
jgi:hypothetical protein